MNPSPQPLASTILHSICVNSTTLGPSYKCNHTVFVFFVTGLFQNVLECLRMASRFIPVSGSPSFLRLINSPSCGSVIYCLSIHPSMDTETPLAIMNLSVSLNSFPLAPCLPSINVPIVLSNQTQPSLPWTSHPTLFLTSLSRLPFCHHFPSPLTFHFTESGLLLKLLS